MFTNINLTLLGRGNNILEFLIWVLFPFKQYCRVAEYEVEKTSKSTASITKLNIQLKKPSQWTLTLFTREESE